MTVLQRWITPGRIAAALAMAVLVALFACTPSPSATSTTVTAQAAPTLLPAPADNSKTALWGFIDTTGKWVIEPQFQGAERFSEGLAAVKLNGTWGYVSESGTVVVPPQYTEVHYFHNGLARVATRPAPDPNDHWLVTATGYGFIDKTGKMVIPGTWDDAGDFSEGLAPVMQGSACGFIDATGSVVIPLQFDIALSFSEGLAPVSTGGKWGYIDKTGRWSVEPTYTGEAPPGTGITELAFLLPVGRFQDGIAAVMHGVVTQSPDGSSTDEIRREYIDAKGKTVFEQVFDNGGDFSEGLAPVLVVDESGNGQWGFIDPSGNMVIKPQFGMDIDGLVLGHAGFHQGLAVVGGEGGLGYIDKTGKFVIPAQFARGGGFRDGFAYVLEKVQPSGTRTAIIDLAGRVIYRAPDAPGAAP